MNAQRMFIVLVLVLVIVSVVGYLVFYLPQVQKLQKVEQQLSELVKKINNANRASVDLGNIEKRLEMEKAELQRIKQKFVHKTDLARVTQVIHQQAKQWDLELVDFSPVLESYFEAGSSNAIKPLPLAITVKGRYLQIGRFLENWSALPFFLMPEEIIIEKNNPQSNTLEATITGILYTWND